jgi:hypothetical protein
LIDRVRSIDFESVAVDRHSDESMTVATAQETSSDSANDLPVGVMPTPPAWRLTASLVAWVLWLVFLAVCNAYSS